MEHVCENMRCGRRGTFPRCSRCKMVYYCSVKCQTDSWPQHKATCRENHLPAIDPLEQTIIRSGLSRIMGNLMSHDRALYQKGVDTGAYQDTTVQLGHGVEFGMTQAGYWIQVPDQPRIELGQLTNMTDTGDAVDRVMRAYGLDICGLDAVKKLMNAIKRVLVNG